MRTVFAQPSNTYTIVLNKEDIMKLVNGGVLYQPLHTENTYIGCYRNRTVDSHYLQYHGPEDGTIPVQFVNIQFAERG